MNTFAWLMMGHLVGDWLLQSDWMAQGKKTGLIRLAGPVHFAIYATVVMGALWLSGVRDKQPVFYLWLSVVLFCSHWLLDGTRLVERWMRLLGQHDPKMVRLMVDQTLHLLVLAALAVLI
jgi:hypothetical protein